MPSENPYMKNDSIIRDAECWQQGYKARDAEVQALKDAKEKAERERDEARASYGPLERLRDLLAEKVDDGDTFISAEIGQCLEVCREVNPGAPLLAELQSLRAKVEAYEGNESRPNK